MPFAMVGQKPERAERSRIGEADRQRRRACASLTASTWRLGLLFVNSFGVNMKIFDVA
jgi:hypothetical protein